MENTVTAQTTLLKPSLVKTTEFERCWLTRTEMWFCRKTANIYVTTEQFTIDVKDNDTTKTVNIKIVVLQSWHIFTRTRTIAVLLKM